MFDLFLYAKFRRSKLTVLLSKKNLFNFFSTLGKSQGQNSESLIECKFFKEEKFIKEIFFQITLIFLSKKVISLFQESYTGLKDPYVCMYVWNNYQ